MSAARAVVVLLAASAMAALPVGIVVIFLSLGDSYGTRLLPPLNVPSLNLPALWLTFASGCVLVAFLIAGVIRLHRKISAGRRKAAEAPR